MNVTKHYRRERFSRYTNDEIEIIARELTAIERREGVVRTMRVLELARAAEHPLHAFVFNCSDREAAERFRVENVRRMCRAVRVVYVDDAGKEKFSTPLLVSCRVTSRREDDEGEAAVLVERAYRSAEKALADPETRRELLEEALRQADYWQQKYRNIEELGPVFAALRKVKGRALRRAKSA